MNTPNKKGDLGEIIVGIIFGMTMGLVCGFGAGVMFLPDASTATTVLIFISITTIGGGVLGWWLSRNDFKIGKLLAGKTKNFFRKLFSLDFFKPKWQRKITEEQPSETTSKETPPPSTEEIPPTDETSTRSRQKRRLPKIKLPHLQFNAKWLVIVGFTMVVVTLAWLYIQIKAADNHITETEQYLNRRVDYVISYMNTADSTNNANIQTTAKAITEEVATRDSADEELRDGVNDAWNLANKAKNNADNGSMRPIN